MDRRKFLKTTSFIGLGGLFIPSTLFSSCRKETLFEDSNYSGKVIIIGSGAAGLYAGYILKSKGIDFQILEASSVFGGRLGKLTGFADFPIDKGAQWLHGKNNLLSDFITASNTKITLDDSEEAYWFNNQIVASLPKDPYIFDAENLPDISFQDYAIQKGFGEEYKYIIENIAGDQGAEASVLSTYWNHQEETNWCSGDDDYKFEETFFDFFEKNIISEISDKIKLNTVVSKIDYSSDKIIVTDSLNTTYSADKVILSIPITMFKNNSIEFTPALPSEKTEAFSKIAMGPGIKVHLKFNIKFYDQNIIGGKICAAYADELVGKNGSDNVLLAFIMGDQAAYLSSLPNDNAIITELLQELDIMYSGQASASFIAGHVEDWSKHPFIMGAYSHSTVNMGNAREVAAKSIDDKLFFAGEAMNLNGHHQTVFGAAETGYREVINILNSVTK